MKFKETLGWEAKPRAMPEPDIPPHPIARAMRYAFTTACEDRILVQKKAEEEKVDNLKEAEFHSGEDGGGKEKDPAKRDEKKAEKGSKNSQSADSQSKDD